MKHILINRPGGFEKSEWIEKLLSETSCPRYGYVTRWGEVRDDGFYPIYIHPADAPKEAWQFSDDNLVGLCDSKIHFVKKEIFDNVGTPLIRAARPDGIIIMNELGFMEADAELFKAAVWDAFQGETPVIAVTKKGFSIEFLNRIRSHPKVDVYDIDKENKDILLPQLQQRIREWGK